jgi:formylglycine-generating enzyme required for sulfatase activity
MLCHTRGVIDKDDEVHAQVTRSPDAFKEERDDILALYPPRPQFRAGLQKDAARFTAAVRQTGPRPGATEPVAALAARFEWDLDLKLVAAEAGLPPEEFLKALARAPEELARAFGPLRVEGGTVKRQVLEAAFTDLVRELDLGQPYHRHALRDDGVLVNSIGMRFKRIAPGRFMMGSPKDEAGRGDDEPRHAVEITEPFHMGVYPVTQQEYAQVMGTNPSFFSATGGGRQVVRGRDTSRHPVERVSWEDTQAFCESLSDLPEERRAGRAYRLPTEAEWEYACRGGATEPTPFALGPSLSSRQANFNGAAPYNAPAGPNLGRTTPVGSYPANRFGLYDMHGNVWQWCADWYDDDAYQNGAARDPRGPESGNRRVLRGGSWRDEGNRCRCAERHKSLPSFKDQAYGFRVVLVEP